MNIVLPIPTFYIAIRMLSDDRQVLSVATISPSNIRRTLLVTCCCETDVDRNTCGNRGRSRSWLRNQRARERGVMAGNQLGVYVASAPIKFSPGDNDKLCRASIAAGRL